MSRLDKDSWGTYTIGSLFRVVKGTRLTKSSMLPGETRFIGSSAKNNGCTALIGNTEHIHPAGTITVCYNGSIGEAFYQDEPFWASDDVNVLYPKFEMDRHSALFFIAVIRSVSSRYTYADKWKLESMLSDTIRLPSNSDGSPDIERMSSYMTSIELAGAHRLDILDDATRQRKRRLSSAEWKHFHISDLFDVVKGTRLTRADMRPGNIPFIGATLENNGITAYISNDEHLHPAEVMTVAYNGQKATGKAFWQPKPFWASDDVNVLYPKFELTREVALFLTPIFWEVGRPYAFDDKWDVEAMSKDSLVLPVVKSGEPDWHGMHEYMSCILERAYDTLGYLTA